MNLNNESVIKKDLLRYKKNTLASTLTYFAIVFDCLFFIHTYSIDLSGAANPKLIYYQWLMGVSVVYNLLFLLIAFLSSEGVKNYKRGYSFVLMGMGAAQIVRVFILPLKARFYDFSNFMELGPFYEKTELPASMLEAAAKEMEISASEASAVIPAMSQFEFIFAACCLLVSAAFCICAGVAGFIKSNMLISYKAELAKRGNH